MIDEADPEPPRWQLRLREFGRMLDLFERTDATRRKRPLNEAEEAGLVQFFEMSVELAWKTMGLWLREQGSRLASGSPLPIIRDAAKMGLIDEADVWSVAVERRNRMSHTYDRDEFRLLIEDAGDRFLPPLKALRVRLEELASS